MTQTMQALVLRNGQNPSFALESLFMPDLAERQVRVAIQTAALNHRDLWIRQGLYANMNYPAILGSDGFGTVVEVANAKDDHWLGKEVIINPALNWGEDPRAQAASFQILGMPSSGTFAEYLAIPADRLYLPPLHLSAQQAAALPLAGLTAYRALITQAQAQPNQTVLITGIGGGVALFAFQFALKLGAQVFVTSGQDEKIARVVQMGASGGVNYSRPDWVTALQALSGGFDIIIDGAGGRPFVDLIELIRPGGCIVNYGATLGEVERLNLRRIFWKQARIQGSTMGTDAEFGAMLEWVVQHHIQPIVDSVRPFKDIISAFDDLHAARQFGKMVVQIQDVVEKLPF